MLNHPTLAKRSFLCLLCLLQANSQPSLPFPIHNMDAQPRLGAGSQLLPSGLLSFLCLLPTYPQHLSSAFLSGRLVPSFVHTPHLGSLSDCPLPQLPPPHHQSCRSARNRKICNPLLKEMGLASHPLPVRWTLPAQVVVRLSCAAETPPLPTSVHPQQDSTPGVELFLVLRRLNQDPEKAGDLDLESYRRMKTCRLFFFPPPSSDALFFSFQIYWDMIDM